jgi:FtsH-binding integral membrane protein
MRLSRQLLSLKSFNTSAGLLPKAGLKNFLSRVYLRSGGGVASTLAVALAAPNVNALALFGTGAVMAFGSIFAIGAMKPDFNTTKDGHHTSTNPLGREVAFYGLTTGLGLSLAPMVSTIQSIDPVILPASVLLSAGIFGGSAYVALKSSVDFSTWKGPLMVGLGCLIGTQIIGFASLLIAGPSSGLAMLLHNVDIYGGIGLFTLMTMYDSYAAKQLYLKGEADDLGCAVNVYLDFMNLLVRIMEAVAKMKEK